MLSNPAIAHSHPPLKKIDAILYVSFFFSGIAGLVYEVLWAKHLSLIFGNTAYAHTLVLAIFMGGLALGSFCIGRLADKVQDKLIFYSLVEIAIALFCVCTPQLFRFTKNIYIMALRDLPLGPIGITAIKFLIGALCILPPTILMGGTLPILSKLMTRSASVRGKIVARLYYINSFGGVAGTTLAGFYLIYHFGLERSIVLAALINLLIGIAVILLRVFSKKTPQPELLIREESSQEYFSEKIIRISLVAIFLSGFIAMLYEIVWIRMLSTILGSSTYSFSLMLAAFITGITIGSFLISRHMPETKRTFLVFGFCEILIGLGLIFSLPFYERLPFFFLKLSGIFARNPETFVFYSTVKFLLSFLVMLPPTIFLGMTLPLVSKIVSRKLEFLGKKVGSVFAFNTTGNIAGALVAGLILLPVLGLKYTLELGIAMNLVIGFIILSVDKELSLRGKICLVSACCVVFLAYKIIIPDWNQVYFSAQLFRHGRDTRDTFRKFSKRLKNKEVLFYKDGPEATVSVMKVRDDLVLYINGKADASTTETDMTAQIFVAELPLILKPDIKDVLVVGLGSGVTCGSALLHPVNGVDLVEISPSVVDAADYFAEFNYNVLRDKRLHIYIEDARTFVQQTSKKYDLIINEPSNPWMSGTATLFTVEYFWDCLSSLKEDGLMIQWINAYEMNDEIFEMIMRTFCSVFPEVTMWSAGTSDIFLIGSKKPSIPDFSDSEKRLTQIPIRKDLSRIELNGLFTLLSFQLASNRKIEETFKMKGSVNRDYFPILEYKAPLALYTGADIKKLIIYLDQRRVPLETGELLIKKYLEGRKIDYADLENLFTYIIEKSEYNKNLLLSLTKRWHDEYPDDDQAALAYAMHSIDHVENTALRLGRLIHEDRKFGTLDLYASFQMRRLEALRSFLLPSIFDDVTDNIEVCVGLTEEKKAKFYFLLGKAYLKMEDYDEALSYYLKAEELIESKKEDAESQGLDYLKLLNNICFAYFRAGYPDESFAYAKKILAQDENNFHAKTMIKLINLRSSLQ